ncbi:MAG: beta-N-acetylglucosaminidase, partial [Muribaculaceae bacterium]|nr:beta-N-acetylglucosaminidase [Muribaculaceae bacterium]
MPADSDTSGSADSIRHADSIQALQRIHNDLTSDALAYADSLSATLTLRQKAAMMLMPATFSRTDPATINNIVAYARDLGVGGIVLLKGSLTAAAEIIDSVYSVAPNGMFIAVDAENGLKMRFSDAPEFPWNRELGRLSDDQLMYEFGREIARECRIVGINMILGPVMDIVPGENYHGIMAKRSLGSSPETVADLAIAYSKGVEDGRVLTVAKHFPGHGSANADSHKALGKVTSSKSRLDSIDLYPFRKYAAEGLSGVMVGHLAVTALDTI